MGDGRPPSAGRADRDRRHPGPEHQHQRGEESLVGNPPRRRPQDPAEPGHVTTVPSCPCGHAGCVEPIFAAVLAGDLSQITAAAAAKRMEEDLLIPGVHWLYRGDTPLHLAAARRQYEAVRALLAAGAPVNAVNRRGAAALHYACDSRPLSPTWDPDAQRRVIELLV